MNRQTFSVIFLVRTARIKKDGRLPVFVRITVNGQRSEFATKHLVNANDWDSKNGKAISDKKLNSYLTLIHGRIQEQYFKLEQFNEPITAHGLKNKYLGIETGKKTILEVFDEHNRKCEGLMNNGFAPATVERYKTTRNHFAEFIQDTYQRPDLFLSELTANVINEFDYFLKTAHKCSHNTATKYLKNFKKITRIALSNGWMSKDPFATIRFHLKDVDMAFLTEDELKRLMALDIDIPRLKRVRDIYLFSCFTGLAFSDTKELTYENIEDLKGNKWIVTRRHKTKQLCRIPMLPPALAIMEQFKSDPYCVNSGRVLPVPSNQKMNAYLQEIADLAGIKKHLSTHTARHTFATTVTLSNNISIEVVAKMLGHTSINMTKKYARVVDDYICKDMKKIEGMYTL